LSVKSRDTPLRLLSRPITATRSSIGVSAWLSWSAAATASGLLFTGASSSASAGAASLPSGSAGAWLLAS
jgi:hypothetical protein